MNKTHKPLSAAIIHKLSQFMPARQLRAVISFARGEEGEFFHEKAAELIRTWETMPSLYEQDGKRGAAVAYLRYFAGGSTQWHITERDKNEPPERMFGLAEIHEKELGYISIKEMCQTPTAELDFWYTPTALHKIAPEMFPAAPDDDPPTDPATNPTTDTHTTSEPTTRAAGAAAGTPGAKDAGKGGAEPKDGEYMQRLKEKRLEAVVLHSFGNGADFVKFTHEIIEKGFFWLIPPGGIGRYCFKMPHKHRNRWTLYNPTTKGMHVIPTTKREVVKWLRALSTTHTPTEEEMGNNMEANNAVIDSHTGNDAPDDPDALYSAIMSEYGPSTEKARELAERFLSGELPPMKGRKPFPRETIIDTRTLHPRPIPYTAPNKDPHTAALAAASTLDDRKILNGAYHDPGKVVVGTTGNIMCVIPGGKADGKVYGKNGECIEGTFPNWKVVIPNGAARHTVTLTTEHRHAINGTAKAAKWVEVDHKNVPQIVAWFDTAQSAYDARLLSTLLRALESSGADTIRAEFHKRKVAGAGMIIKLTTDTGAIGVMTPIISPQHDVQERRTLVKIEEYATEKPPEKPARKEDREEKIEAALTNEIEARFPGMADKVQVVAVSGPPAAPAAPEATADEQHDTKETPNTTKKDGHELLADASGKAVSYPDRDTATAAALSMPGWMVHRPYRARRFFIEREHSAAFYAGQAAFAAGTARRLPDTHPAILTTGDKEAWYNGWDCANAEAKHNDPPDDPPTPSGKADTPASEEPESADADQNGASADQDQNADTEGTISRIKGLSYFWKYETHDFGTERTLTVTDPAGNEIGTADPFARGIPADNKKRLAKIRRTALKIAKAHAEKTRAAIAEEATRYAELGTEAVFETIIRRRGGMWQGTTKHRRAYLESAWAEAADIVAAAANGNTEQKLAA